MRRTLLSIAALVLSLGVATALPGSPAGAQEGGPHLAVTPTSGPIGTVVTITGNSDFGPDSGGVCEQAISNYIVTQSVWIEVDPAVQWDDAGNFTATATIPTHYTDGGQGASAPLTAGTTITFLMNCPYGPLTADFTVTAGGGATTSTTAPATTVPPFTPPAEPPADADPFGAPPAPVPPGGTVTIGEGGFTAGELVHVVLYSEPQVLASARADAQGTLAIAVTVPDGTEPGEHTLVLFGSSKVVKAPLTVLALPGQAPGATADTLPRTGSTSATGSSAALAALLVVAGTGLVAASRRPALRRTR